MVQCQAVRVTWAVTGHKRRNFGKDLRYIRVIGFGWTNLAVHMED